MPTSIKGTPETILGAPRFRWSAEVGLRAQERSLYPAGRRALDYPRARESGILSNQILVARQHQGSTSAIQTALNALVAN
jgi:hypothetical protein